MLLVGCGLIHATGGISPAGLNLSELMAAGQHQLAAVVRLLQSIRGQLAQHG